MTTDAFLTSATALLALVFSLALLDQWRERRGAFQLAWGIGMLFFGIAAATEAIAQFSGWSEPLYRTWYLTGAVWTVGWLGLGTAFLLGRTRFGYAFALCLFLAGLFTFLVRNRPEYAGAGSLPLLYFISAAILALAVAVETYFQNERWPVLAAGAVVGATLLSLVLMVTAQLPPPGYAVDPTTGVPVGDIIPGYLRLLTPFMNITGSFALILGAVFSTYVFMPKRRVLPYSLDPNQPGDQFLFNLIIAPFAITVNLVASLPATGRALLTGNIHSRVPATILIAIGAFIPSITDSLNRFGSTELFHLGKFLGVVFLFAGFLVSIEVFREIRVPFTGIRLSTRRREAPSVVESVGDTVAGRPVSAAGEAASKASTPH
jgi:hypothetical protein